MKSKDISIGILVALVLGSVLLADFFPVLYGEYADQRLLLSLLLVFSIAFSLLTLCKRGLLSLSLVQLWPFGLLVLSFMFAAYQFQTSDFYLVEPIFYSFYFLAFGIVGYLIRVTGSTYRVATITTLVIAFFCFCYAAMSMTVYGFALFDGFAELDKLIPWGFVSIRYWSHIATWLVPIFPLFVLVGPLKENSLWRFASAFTAAIWWWILFMSASRGSMLGLLVSLVLVLAFFRKASVPWAIVFVRYAAYGCLAWLLLSIVIPSLVFEDHHVREIRGDSSGRLPLWFEAWQMSTKNFPFGMGPQSWLTHDVLTEAYEFSRKFGHPHNMYLMWAAEYGWLSVFGVAVLCGVALGRLFRRIARIKKEPTLKAGHLVAFTASVMASLVHAGVSAVYLAPGSMLVGLVVLSIFWSLICSGRMCRTDSNFCSPKRSNLLGGALIVGFLSLSLFWIGEVLHYRKAMAEDLAVYQENGSLGQLPRFWLHGYFPRHPGSLSSSEN